MEKPTLAFVDHSFHKKTRSSDFLRELMRESYSVSEYWDESWNGGSSVSLEVLNQHDYVFFMQVRNPLSELKRITAQMIWAPMYDGFRYNYPYLKALSQLRVKVLSFSIQVSSWMKAFSIPTMTVQYYYLRPEMSAPVSGNHIFFWYRGGISFDDLRPILDPNQIDSFTILENPDPKSPGLKITEEDKKKYSITHLVESFIPREQYLQILNQSNIFIAPRKKEGIGAFTEALAVGKCVIAYDDAVHNEYITHGVDGFLFSKQSGLLDLTDVNAIGARAFERATKAHNQWLSDREAVASFMTQKHTPSFNSVSFAFWSSINHLNLYRQKIRYYFKTGVSRLRKILHIS